jgi:nicotinamide riboside transporter PnuC
MEIVGVIAGVLELAAVYLVGIKNKLGFITGILGNILWITFCVVTQSSFGLLIVCPVAFALNIKGYLRWSRDEKKQEVLSREGTTSPG